MNPYLAFAASLLAGYIGMIKELEPSEPLTTSAYNLSTNRLPQHFLWGLDNMAKCKELRTFMSEEFIQTYLGVKQTEYTASTATLSPWEIRYLLLNV